MVAKYKKLWPPSCDPSVGPIDSTICRFWWTPQKVIFFTGQLCTINIFLSVHLWAVGIFFFVKRHFWLAMAQKKWDEFHLTREWEGYILARCPRSQYCFFFLLFSSSQSENGDEFKSDGMTFTHSAEIWTDHVCSLHAFYDNNTTGLLTD